MNLLQLETGGRPVANDDFSTLQTNIPLLGLPALLYGLAPCVVSGGRVSGNGPAYNVGAGMVWDGTQLLDFPGAGAVTLPLMFQAGGVTVVNERPYQTGGTKTCITGQRMALVPVVAGAPNLVLDTWGCLQYADLVRASVRYVGETLPVGSLGYSGSDYNTTGLGKPGTPAWGWALANGQNGTDDLRGLVVLGHNPDRSTDGQGYNISLTAVGQVGGEEQHTLLASELPAHSHGINDGFMKQHSRPSTVTGASGSGDGASPASGNTQLSTGGGQAHNNMAPFIALPYRQGVGY